MTGFCTNNYVYSYADNVRTIGAVNIANTKMYLGPLGLKLCYATAPAPP